MNRSICARLVALSLLPVSLALFGCGGAMSIPDTQLTTQVSGPAIHGSAYGGHAPIVGMHVYLLQPGTGGYGSAATPILGNDNNPKTATDGSGFALTLNTSDPNVPNAAYYVTTNSQGEFDLTGMYSCTADEPVYIYAYGGSPSGYITGSISSITVAFTQSGEADYVVTLSPSKNLTNAFVKDQLVTISGLTGDFAALNGSTQQVVTLGTSNSFEFAAKIINGVSNHDDYIVTGSISTLNAPVANPIVELATLGNCPSSGQPNFGDSSTDPLSYIYMNEVSTVATAYTFQPFTSSTNNTAWDIGTPGGSALKGIENAANNAGQLYDIQGRGTASSTSDGEGHIANLTTPATLGGAPTGGNGTAPQATVDTLANILATCLDSPPNPGYAISPTCTSLFDTATSNGSAYYYGFDNNSVPTDIATAAINIARYPGGNGNTRTSGIDPVNSYTAALFDIQGGTLPYAPNLANAPNDFTLTIAYSGGGIGTTSGTSPHGVAVDASGYVYAVNSASDQLSILTALGAPVSGGASGFSGNGLSSPNSVAIDLSGNVWVANAGSDSVSEFYGATATTNSPGGAVANHSARSGTGAEDAEIDGLGNIWVTTNAPSLVELASGTFGAGAPNRSYVANSSSLAIEAGVRQNNGQYAETDYVWVDCSNHVQNQGTYSCGSLNNTSNGAVNGDPFYGNGGPYGYGGPYYASDFSTPMGIAIDSTGDAWFADNNGNVSELTYAGGSINTYYGYGSGSPFSTGTNSGVNDGVAIDGGGNIWVTSPGAGALYELSNTGNLISPSLDHTSGYTPLPGVNPDGIAIDGSGNVWYSSSSTDAVYEVIGSALPVVTPIASGVAHRLLGSEPTLIVP